MSENGFSARKVISIICPVFNEEETVPLFYRRLQNVLAPLRGRYDFELIFINNRSSDRTLDILLDLRKRDPSVQILTMSRNFGYQASLHAGLLHCSGDGSIFIDVDCEDPPELIPQFLVKWEEGYDIVYGMRIDRHENWIIKKLRNLFYHVLQAAADNDIVLYMAEFALISSSVRHAIIDNQNTFLFLRAEIGYAGFSRYGIQYKRHPRVAGKSHYHIGHMLEAGAAGILTSSTFLLRLAVYLFPLAVLFNAVIVLLSRIASRPRFFEELVAVDFVYLMFLLTTQAMYISRIYKNGVGRPLFILDPKHTYAAKHKTLERRSVPV